MSGSCERVLTAIGWLQEAAALTPVETLVTELVEALAADTTTVELRQEVEFLKAEVANVRHQRDLLRLDVENERRLRV